MGQVAGKEPQKGLVFIFISNAPPTPHVVQCENPSEDDILQIRGNLPGIYS
jgi:hypothetical protein